MLQKKIVSYVYMHFSNFDVFTLFKPNKVYDSFKKLRNFVKEWVFRLLIYGQVCNIISNYIVFCTRVPYFRINDVLYILHCPIVDTNSRSIITHL